MDESASSTSAPAPIRWRDFFGLWITLFFWIFWATIFALLSLRVLGPGAASIAWLSILSGPFAFFDPPGFTVAETLTLAIVCAASIGIHFYARHWFTSVLACLGVSLWFMMGLGLTFIGV